MVFLIFSILFAIAAPLVFLDIYFDFMPMWWRSFIVNIWLWGFAVFLVFFIATRHGGRAFLGQFILLRAAFRRVISPHGPTKPDGRKRGIAKEDSSIEIPPNNEDLSADPAVSN